MKTFRWLDTDCCLDLSHVYVASGRPSIRVITAELDEPMAAASTNLDIPLGPDEVAIKNWSENEGLLEVLIAHGIVDSPHRTVPSGYVDVPICRYYPEKAAEFTIQRG